ncbi:MAG: ASKHA domain-containing protein [Candidatus Binatia bacterium]
MNRHRVRFLPSGQTGEIDQGVLLRDAARLFGLGVETICGGRASCGKCKVRIVEGGAEEHGIASSQAHLSASSPAEQRRFAHGELRPDERLSCQARVQGDLLVYIPEESRTGRPIALKAAGDRTIQIVPTIRKRYVELPPPDLSRQIGDWERLCAELNHRFDLHQLSIDSCTLQSLSPALQASKGAITVTVWADREIIRVEPEYSEKGYGLAVDLGTTSVAAYLCDLASGEVLATGSMLNPQIEHGEDIMTRIANAHTRERLETMQRLIVNALGGLAHDVAREASITPEDIVEVVLVGNTVMHHLFLGLDVRPLGVVPFAPSISHSLDIKARDLGLAILPSANVHVLPIEAGFVGADNVAVLIAEEPYAHDEVQLIIDIGTNGELLLGNRQRILSASCPTGPAFEGASIKFGTRASKGAIDKVRIDPATLDVRFSVIGNGEWSTRCEPGQMRARGLCGSALIDAIAEMLGAGVVNKSGRIDNARTSSRLRPSPEGGYEFVIAWAEQTAIAEDITVTQDDVRAIQLAKAALYAGSQLLLRRFGIDRPDRVVLAGAFGSAIDVERALRIGLFPDCGIENVRVAGNAAGDGARIALLNRDKRAEAEWFARKVEYVELTTEPGFMESFVEATHLPDASDSFPSVAEDSCTTS